GRAPPARAGGARDRFGLRATLSSPAVRSMTKIVALDLSSWRPVSKPETQQRAIGALEGGGVLVLPRLAFGLMPEERRFLSTAWSDERAKNISLEGRTVRGG